MNLTAQTPKTFSGLKNINIFIPFTLFFFSTLEASSKHTTRNLLSSGHPPQRALILILSRYEIVKS